MSAERPLGPSPAPQAPPGRINLAGRGLQLEASPGLPVTIGQFEADLIDLTPADPLTLQRGELDIRIKQASLAVPADRLAGFLQAQLKSDGVRKFQLRFEPPDRAIATAEVKVKGQFTPVRLEGRLLPVNGGVGFQPTALSGTIEGVAVRWRPAGERLEADISDERLMALLLPGLKSKSLADVQWRFAPGNRVSAEATVTLGQVPGALKLDAGLAALPDGRLEIRAREATLDWRGLRFHATPPDEKARITASQESLSRLLAEEIDVDRLRNLSFRLHPGNRFSAAGEVRERGEWLPVTIEGRLAAERGALKIAPEALAVKGARGGIDLTFRPQTGRTEGAITQAAINQLLAPIVAKEGFEDFNLRFLDGNRFVLEGVRVDDDNPKKRKDVRIEGAMRLEGGDAVRFDFQKIKYGRISVNFGHLHVKALQALGLHLDDVLKLNEPFARMKKDTLYFYPGKLSDKIRGTLADLTVTDGRLSVTADLTTDVRELIKFKRERFDFDGKAFYVRPETVSKNARGTVTGVSTGDGTIALDARLTPDDLKHIVRLKENKLDFHGDRVVLDPNRLQDRLPGRVLGLETRDGQATVALGVAAEDAARLAPAMAGGARFDGRAIAMPLSAIDRQLHGEVTGLSVVDGEVRVQVGQAPARPRGNQVEAALTGAITIKGITIEDADAVLVDATPDTPLDPRRLKDGQLTIRRGRAFVPRERAEALVREHLAGRDLKGFQVAYAPGGLTVKGSYGPLPVSGRVRLSGAGDRLVLKPEGVRLWKIPVPDWIATRLVGRLAGLPRAEDGLGVPLSKIDGVTLGPLGEVRAAEDGLHVRIGD